ncbi:MAG TPA: acetylornithine deacetylase [Pyrinomonadaceae bacterium]|jgi:acetylornithine deacetylase
MNVKNTLAELVSINSVSSRSNLEIANYLVERCERLGFSVKRFPYLDELGVEKHNLVALAGTEFSQSTEVELALVGHTDTVPFDDKWTEALSLTEREGKLFARGSCDTKAFIAAALTAVESVGAAKLLRALALIFTADEEVGLLGAKRLAAERPLRARYSIVGEPTSLQPMRAGKGYSLAQIVLRGREAHSAYPAYGVSAIFSAARLVTRIEDVAKQLEAEQHPAFDPPFTTLNVGVIQGGTAKNVIPGECQITLEWRPIPGQNSSRVEELVNQAIDAERQNDPNFDCSIQTVRADFGYETSADSKLIKLLEETSGKRSGTVAFGTEAAQMMELGAEAVVIGPGDIRVAHRTGEFVPITELESCVDILKTAIRSFCC